MTRPSLRRAAALVLCAVGLFPSWTAAQTLALPWDDSWERRDQGDWTLAVDARALAAMRHPDLPATRGNFALLQRAVRVPDDWRGSISLVLYCADNYHGVRPPDCAPGIAARVLPGRRFKQVLVDAAVVWSQDVADAVPQGDPALLRIPLPVEPGQTFQLGLMVYDADGTETTRPGDFHCPEAESPPGPIGFPVGVFWGDVQLLAGDAEAVPGLRPAEARVLRRHAARWPVPEGNTATFKGDRARFRVDGPPPPAPGFPARVGVPLPPGRVAQAADFRLRAPGGAAIAARKSPTARWPDQSWKWALVEFTATPGLKEIDLHFQRDPARSPRVGLVLGGNAGDDLRAGELRLRAGEGNPFRDIAHRGKVVVEDLRLALQTGGVAAPGTVLDWSLGQVGAPDTAVFDGVFDGQASRHGAFRLAVAGFADLPLLRLDCALTNDTGAPLSVQALTLEFDMPEPPSRAAYGGEALPLVGVLHQADARRLLLNGEPLAVPPGPHAIALDGLLVALPDLRTRYPKRITWDADSLQIDLCAAGDQPITLHPGERLSHTLWLGFDVPDAAAFAQCAQSPPVLVNRDYALSTGAWDSLPALPPEHPLLAGLAAHAALDDAALGLGTGIRHHGAHPHFGGDGHWANNFTERLLGLWTAWALTGDRRWHDRARTFGSHLLDVGVVHGSAPGMPAGAMRGPGRDHAGAAWSPVQRSTGLVAAWRETGDNEYRLAAERLASYCREESPGRGASGARHHAAPLETLGNAYEASEDPEWLDVAAGAVDAVWSRIDRRRGAWSEMQASWTHRATSPWHAAQLGRALFRWYRVSGDVEAAQAVVALADAVLWEPEGIAPPWAVAGADAPPHAPGRLALLAMAHDLSGDPAYADAIRSALADWLAAGAPVSPYDTLWMLDLLGPWMLPESDG